MLTGIVGLISKRSLIVRFTVSGAPKANEDLARAKFCTEMAKAKNASALGVRVNTIVGPAIAYLAPRFGPIILRYIKTLFALPSNQVS